MVEHFLAKEDVEGSNPFSRSRLWPEREEPGRPIVQAPGFSQASCTPPPPCLGWDRMKSEELRLRKCQRAIPRPESLVSLSCLTSAVCLSRAVIVPLKKTARADELNRQFPRIARFGCNSIERLS